jgi:hypothetical protein
LDVTAVNAYAVYLHDLKASGAQEKPMSRKTFITRIAQGLMGPVRKTPTVGKKRKAEEVEVEEGKWYCPGEKYAQIEGEGRKVNEKTRQKTKRKRACKLCDVKTKKRKQGRCECLGCGWAFHDRCFREWHDEYATCIKIE